MLLMLWKRFNDIVALDETIAIVDEQAKHVSQRDRKFRNGSAYPVDGDFYFLLGI